LAGERRGECWLVGFSNESRQRGRRRRGREREKGTAGTETKRATYEGLSENQCEVLRSPGRSQRSGGKPRSGKNSRALRVIGILGRFDAGRTFLGFGTTTRRGNIGEGGSKRRKYTITFVSGDRDRTRRNPLHRVSGGRHFWDL